MSKVIGVMGESGSGKTTAFTSNPCSNNESPILNIACCPGLSPSKHNITLFIRSGNKHLLPLF